MLTRRGFLHQSVGALALGSGLPPILERALAAQAVNASVHGDPGHRRVLVLLQLTGGNDGLNTVVPIEDDLYYKARPNVNIPKKDARKIGDLTALAPPMKNLEAAFHEGRLAVVQSVGYPNPNRSHFHSMDVWHTGDPELTQTRTGWLGRAMDAHPAAKDNALFAFHIGDEAPRMLLSERQRVTAFTSVNDYGLQADRNAPNDRVKIERALEQMMGAGVKEVEPSGSRGVALVRKTAAQALASARDLKEALAKSTTSVNYPNGGLSQHLKLAGQAIGAELPVHLISIGMGGFDTHANQRSAHASLWTQIDEALAAFHEDLTKRQCADDVVVFVFSEFGRRVAENGSSGTDHGAAAPAFLFGTPVKGGLYGEAPNLTSLDDGDVKFAVDFRRIYSTLLKEWVGVEAAPVLGGGFEGLDIVKPIGKSI